MNKEIVAKWEKYKGVLKKHFQTNLDFYRSWECDYEDVVKAVVKHVVNAEGTRFDYESMTVIDDGDYQGMQLFIFPRSTYQPSEDDYLVTYEYYGSCSGCDSLQAMQEESKDMQLSILMDMALHLIQNMKFIYGEDE